MLDYLCSLSHIGYVYMLPVLLAYINRPLLYIIICDSIYNLSFNKYYYKYDFYFSFIHLTFKITIKLNHSLRSNSWRHSFLGPRPTFPLMLSRLSFAIATPQNQTIVFSLSLSVTGFSLRYFLLFMFLNPFVILSLSLSLSLYIYIYIYSGCHTFFVFGFCVSIMHGCTKAIFLAIKMLK
jgi:hypothetical protein